jgi:lysophospholipase L1-like esterase
MTATDRRIPGAAPQILVPPAKTTIRKNDTIVMLGDSLTSVAYVYWQAFRDACDLAVSGLTWVNQGVSGAGLLAGTAELLGSDASIAARMTPSNPHCLFIELGVNDIKVGTPWDPIAFRDAMISLCRKSLAACPNLDRTRILISSLWFAWGEPIGTNTAYEVAANECLLATMEAAATVGCAFLDQRTPRVRTGSQTADGTHPTSTGKTNLSNRLIAATTLVP